MEKSRFTFIGMVIFILGLVIVSVSSGFPAATQLNKSVIAGSNGSSAVANIGLRGSLGQPIIGRSTMNTTKMTSGFWWTQFSGAPGGKLLFLPTIARNFCDGFPGLVEIEDNDYLDQANGPLCFGHTYKGSIYDANENETNQNTEDWFYVVWNASGTLHVQVEEFPEVAQVRLYHESSSGSSVAGLANQPGGNYSLDYDGAAGSGRYAIRLFVPGDERLPGATDYSLTTSVR